MNDCMQKYLQATLLCIWQNREIFGPEYLTASVIVMGRKIFGPEFLSYRQEKQM